MLVSPGSIYLLLPLAVAAIPFALLCVALFLRSRRAWVSVILNAAVWPGASYLTYIAGSWAFRTFGETGHRTAGFVIFPLAGALGAVGVTLADAIVCRRLFAPRCLAIAAGLGAIGVCLARLPFDASLYNALEELATVVVWQAFVGTYLYWECAERGRTA